MSRCVFGTAGHIDHGKTALVRALTGVDTDRLKEEQARGITIELGFAEIDFGDGLRAGFVDVPGHEAFVRAMVAGASGLDAALVVVAADEGPMPQTLEHLAVLGFMGVEQAVVALTKADLVEDEWIELVEDEVRDLLAGTALADAPILPTSVKSGLGIDQVRAALADLARAGSRRTADDVFRLPIDRAFTVRGTGTVVTGTVWSGSVREGQRVTFQPAGREARVRRIHVHGRDVDRVEAGARAALALAGVPTEEVPRGSDVVDVDGWEATTRITASVRLVDPGRILDRGRRLRVHLATSEVMARAYPLGQMDEEAWVEFRMEQPVLSRAGDRLVLRSYSPVTTIGGGTVLEPDPPRRKASRADASEVMGLAAADPVERSLSAVELSDRGGLPVALLPVLAGVTRAQVADVLRDERLVVLDDRAYTLTAAARAHEELMGAVARYHGEHPLEPGIPVERLRPEGRHELRLTEFVLGRAVDENELERDAGRIRVHGHAPSLTESQQARARELAAELARAGLGAPQVTDLSGSNDLDETQALLEHLVRSGSAVRLSSSLVLDRTAVDAFVERVRTELAGQKGLGPADFRPLADVSRRVLVPLLQHLDVMGVTARVGDLRDVAG